MAEADIPVDLFNPGQVFACLGFLEAADILLGDAESGFDWHDKGGVRFQLHTKGDENPFEAVLAFLAEAEARRFGPVGYADPPPKKGGKNVDEQDADEDDEAESEMEATVPTIDLSETFLAEKGDRMTLPIRIGGGNYPVIELGHWADGSNRETFKLYSGNRSADRIARAMLKGVREKPSKKQRQNGLPGYLKTKGLAQLWKEDRERLTREPLHVLTPMGGSFNFDPRGAWTAIDAGYSPNDQKPKHTVEASPVVEFLAAWGLEHARPAVFDNRQVRYAVWGIPLSPMIARAALVGAIPSLPMKHFRFTLDSSGKNKIVTFAEEEI
jgi:CRISPR-associated protein Csx14